MTKWNYGAMSFSRCRHRRVRVDFSGGSISSNGGGPGAQASRSRITRTSISWVSRGRPGIEAATPPMIAPGVAAASSQSDTAPSAWTSWRRRTLRWPADLRSAKLGPSERHSPRPYRAVLFVKRSGSSHLADGLRQRLQLTQLGLHRSGPKLFDEPPAGNCPVSLAPGSGLRGDRPTDRNHGMSSYRRRQPVAGNHIGLLNCWSDASGGGWNAACRDWPDNTVSSGCVGIIHCRRRGGIADGACQPSFLSVQEVATGKIEASSSTPPRLPPARASSRIHSRNAATSDRSADSSG